MRGHGVFRTTRSEAKIKYTELRWILYLEVTISVLFAKGGIYSLLGISITPVWLCVVSKALRLGIWWSGWWHLKTEWLDVHCRMKAWVSLSGLPSIYNNVWYILDNQ